MNPMQQLENSDWLKGLRWNDVKRAMPIAGVALVMMGLVRRSSGSILLAAIGGGLIYEGLRGGNWSRISYEKGMPTQRTLMHDQGIRIEQEITVARPREELYQFWRNLENLPRVMSHLESVRVISPARSHWVAHAPAGMSVAWDAEIINDVENERISWRSMEGADVANAGSVQFTSTPGGSDTVVYVNLKYDLPLGPLGAAVAKLFGTDPEQSVADDLRHFKTMMEMGELVMG
jgi:uncharacterized membrane protein